MSQKLSYSYFCKCFFFLLNFSIKNLVKTFLNDEKEETNVIDHLDLTVFTGQITAILG